jgi:hypothetical protein
MSLVQSVCVDLGEKQGGFKSVELVLAKVGSDLGKRRNLPRGGLLLCDIKIPNATFFFIAWSVGFSVCIVCITFILYRMVNIPGE